MIKGIIPRAILGGLIAAMLAGPAGAQQRKLAVPNDLQLLIMIKTTLLAFNDANATGNYTVLRDLASPEFQQSNSPARLGEIFHAERAQNVDISPIVLLQPKLWRPASIDAQGLLHVQGYFPSAPKQVHFTLAFRVVAGRWRLFALGVRTAEPVVAAQVQRNDQTAAKSKSFEPFSPVSQIVRRSWPEPAQVAQQDYGGYWGWTHPNLMGQFR
jgi:hypothetical protein